MHCIAENDIHYNPLPNFAKLYNGTTLIDSSILDYTTCDNDYFQYISKQSYSCDIILSSLDLSTGSRINYDLITVDLFNGATNVTVTASNTQFTFSMDGNILTIQSTEGSWNKTNHSFYINYVNSEGEQAGSVVTVNYAADAK